MKIGIIGNGFVGKATKILACNNIKIITYDIKHDLCEPKGITLNDICSCDIIFVSVPTPMNNDGSCHLKILESVISNLNNYIDLNTKCVVIRSTVPPGTSDSLNCYFMPEFLTEKNFKSDFINNQKWIFGLKGVGQDDDFKDKINCLIFTSFKNGKIKYNNIHYVLNSEAELIKLYRNTFLALKVSFCNEIYEFCQKKGINYENVRLLAAADPRINLSHTNVPGPDGQLGYGGTCFPKDMHNLLQQMNKISMKSYIIESAIKRNEEVDRHDKDWNLNIGRSVVWEK